MASLRRRISPEQDAIEHAAKGLDKTAKLELKYINSFKGRGVFTTACFSKGDFVVEYRGEFIDPDEAQRRRTIYHGSCGVFMFDFQWHEKTWCIDAALEDRSLGRLVNDDHKQPNCKMKKILAERKPHLCLFTLRDINAGEEITYDYGGVNWPWREQDGAPLTETDASKNETLETSEQTLQGPADFQIEDGAPLTETDASKNETLETSEQTLQGPADFQIEDGAPLTETDASKNETLETSEQTLQGPADFQIEDGAPLTETDASKNETLETSEQTLQGPADFQIEDGAPLTETDASKNETLETSEQTLQGPADFQIEDGAPLTETDASKNETLETSEQTLQGPADFQIEGSDATGPLPSVERVSLVDYTHSDVSQGPSMSPDSEQDDFPIPRLRRTKTILVCGAKRPESLTSTRLRKQTGTLSQVLNLTNTELDQLADLMGHDIRVHRQFYRLPEGTLQLAKISKVLIALEKGRLAEFKGKTLDEIHIDPKENLYPDSDAEEACEPDSPESQATTSQSQKSDGHLSDSSPLPTPLQQSTMVPHHTQHPPQSPTRQRARQPLKKRVWEKDEVLAVERHMMSFITMCRVPGKKDCEKCLQQERIALRHRNWLGIKFYIKNRITALKRKV